MKLSTLIKELYWQSEFTSVNSLAETTANTQPFTDSFINSTKVARKKEDQLFDSLTKDISVGELLSAIELIKQVRLNQIEKEQFL